MLFDTLAGDNVYEQGRYREDGQMRSRIVSFHFRKFISIQNTRPNRKQERWKRHIVFIFECLVRQLGKRKECYKGSRRRRREHV